jgi:hypothetical protein
MRNANISKNDSYPRGEDSDGDKMMVVGEFSPLLLSSRMSNRSKSSQSASVEGENMLLAVAPTTRYLDDGVFVQARVLNNIERGLRLILLIFGIYLLGWKQSIPFLTPYVVWNVLYFIGIAWGTCALIKVISWISLTYYIMDSQCVEEDENAQGNNRMVRGGVGYGNRNPIMANDGSMNLFESDDNDNNGDGDDEAGLEYDDLRRKYKYQSILHQSEDAQQQQRQQQQRQQQQQQPIQHSVPQSTRRRSSSFSGSSRFGASTGSYLKKQEKL